jgi:hypothetical protein
MQLPQKSNYEEMVFTPDAPYGNCESPIGGKNNIGQRAAMGGGKLPAAEKEKPFKGITACGKR